MKHLSREELLDAVEGKAPLAAHLDECAACRDSARALSRVLDEVRGDSVPEPSPLFWDHLSRRVSEALGRETRAPRRARHWPLNLVWPSRLRVLATAGAVACALALVVVALHRSPAPRPAPGTSGAAALTAAPQAAASVGIVEDDDAWRTLTELVDAETEETARPVAVSEVPGGAEAAALRLSDGEQQELVRLLRAATKAGRPRGQG